MHTLWLSGLAQSLLLLLLIACEYVAIAEEVGVVGLPSDKKRWTSGEVKHIREELYGLEWERVNELKNDLKSKNISIHGFYHMTKLLPHWLEVFQEQLRLLGGYHRDLTQLEVQKIPPGLMALVDKLHIFEMVMKNFKAANDIDAMLALRNLGLGFEDRVEHTTVPSIDRKQYKYVSQLRAHFCLLLLFLMFVIPMFLRYCKLCSVWARNKTKMSELLQEHQRTGLALGEYPTISALHQHCQTEVQAGRNSIVFYMHLKSANKAIETDTAASRATAIAFWREAMNTLTIEYSSICIRALLRGASVCGSLYRHVPTSHFAGNFFWASCNHVAQLAPLPSPVSDFEAAEFFLMRTFNKPSSTALFATRCAYEVFGGERRFYHEPIRPEEYIARLHELIDTPQLPPCGISAHPTRPSFLCIKNTIFNGVPCLSALSKTDPSVNNYYNVSFTNIKTFRWNKLMG
jgi:hypothetical protein